MTRKVLMFQLRRVTRNSWVEYYINKYNKTLNPDCAIMAMWYMFLELADDN